MKDQTVSVPAVLVNTLCKESERKDVTRPGQREEFGSGKYVSGVFVGKVLRRNFLLSTNLVTESEVKKFRSPFCFDSVWFDTSQFYSIHSPYKFTCSTFLKKVLLCICYNDT